MSPTEDSHSKARSSRKSASRKWRAFLYAFWISTSLLVLQLLFDGPAILDGTQWVAFNTLTYGVYVGGNVMAGKTQYRELGSYERYDGPSDRGRHDGRSDYEILRGYDEYGNPKHRDNERTRW